MYDCVCLSFFIAQQANRENLFFVANYFPQHFYVNIVTCIGLFQLIQIIPVKLDNVAMWQNPIFSFCPKVTDEGHEILMFSHKKFFKVFDGSKELFVL